MNQPERTVYLHVGTHKTGTTSVQAFITMNEPALATVGIFVPKAGRPTRAWGTANIGHHNIAWELNGLPSFRPEEGTFDQALEEIERRAAPRVVLSSEDFEWLHDKPSTMAYVKNRFAALGYATTVIVYLRAQPEYIQAMYTENAKAGIPVNFKAVLDDILERGAWVIENPSVRMAVDYAPLVDGFASVFGAERTIVRPYRAGRRPAELLQEFLALVGAERLPWGGLLHPAAMNPSPTLGQVLSGLYGPVGARDPGAPSPQNLVDAMLGPGEMHVVGRKFDVMRRDETRSVYERFADSNQALEGRYAVRVPMQPDAGAERGGEHWTVVEAQRRVLEAAMNAWKVTARTK
jgi:hypothetical protein